MCDCENVKLGSYDNQVDLKVPDNIIIRYNNDERNIKKYVNIDRCLKEEILGLWSLGIVTTGCCCGHNKTQPYIGVLDEYIDIMKNLGYKVHFNPNRPNDEDSFYPKSIKY